MSLLLIAIILTVLGILYILSPIDLLPDFIPGVGWIDDLLVLIGIVFMWAIVFGVFIIKALFPFIVIVAMIIAVVYVFKFLTGRHK